MTNEHTKIAMERDLFHHKKSTVKSFAPRSNGFKNSKPMQNIGFRLLTQRIEF